MAQPSRITRRIDNHHRVTLAGHIHPKALAGADQGQVDASMPMPRVTLMFQPTASQQADLDRLLVDQQDPSSPDYHHWLTPEQYADRFGISQADMDQVKAWLASQRLTVVGVARARNWIAVSGTAGAVEQAFGTPIDRYLVNGELHYANATNPSIPAALQGVVSAIRGLTDFRLRPAVRSRARAIAHAVTPQYNSLSLCGGHCVGPDDLAVIYNITPLFDAGLDGSGQTVAVVGQSDIRLADIEQFRTFFNLPANDPQLVLVPGSVDPGISQGDIGESELDLELVGAVARNATVQFVYSSDVMTSAQYVIDQNLAPVLSISYGDCEAAYAPFDAYNSLLPMSQQANVEGITWFAASGDAGATDCYGDPGLTNADGIASVDMPASLPGVTGIGGTQLNEGSGNYWAATNTANNSSALSYIPETAWNTTAIDGTPSASGGGASVYFPKPTWQAGPGVPNDNARDVPDLAISASPDHDGYLIFTSDPSMCGGSGGGSTMCQAVVGGTSAGGPAFAGLAALLNQSFVAKGLEAAPGLGNINPTLYSLFQSSASAFHDITTGNNIINVTCTNRRLLNCTPGPVGFSAGPGYDQVTGIGSVDAAALLAAWTAELGQHTGPPSTTMPAPTIGGIANGASFTQVFAPGGIVSIFGTHLAAGTQAAASTPLPTSMAGVTVTIDGFTAPIWYASPGQLNVQLSYEVPLNATLAVQVNTSGGPASASIIAGAAAPGIFVDQQGAPAGYASAARNGYVTLWITGAGAVSPAVADGAAPLAGTPVNSLPAPQQPVAVTVGGVNAPIQFVGIPQGLVGVVQINVQVPAGTPMGAQRVVVTVGGVPSSPAVMTVTQ